MSHAAGVGGRSDKLQLQLRLIQRNLVFVQKNISRMVSQGILWSSVAEKTDHGVPVVVAHQAIIEIGADSIEHNRGSKMVYLLGQTESGRARAAGHRVGIQKFDNKRLTDYGNHQHVRSPSQEHQEPRAK